MSFFIHEWNEEKKIIHEWNEESEFILRMKHRLRIYSSNETQIKLLSSILARSWNFYSLKGWQKNVQCIIWSVNKMSNLSWRDDRQFWRSPKLFCFMAIAKNRLACFYFVLVILLLQAPNRHLGRAGEEGEFFTFISCNYKKNDALFVFSFTAFYRVNFIQWFYIDFFIFFFA